MMAKLVCVTTNEFLRLATSALYGGTITTATNMEVAVNSARNALASNESN
jgi:hypothetical protein